MKQLKEWIRALLIAFLTVLLVKAFIFEIFTIPTSSMEKTLLPGDLILVNKLSYGTSLPFISYKLPATSEIKRNDIVVFFYPLDDENIFEKSYYIKRCVALPGDTLTIKNKLVYINNTKQDFPKNVQFNYNIFSESLSEDTLKKYEITEGGRAFNSKMWQLTLTNKAKAHLKKQSYIQQINDIEVPFNAYADYIFPYHPFYRWNINYYGELIIPKKGTTVALDSNSIYLYERIINVYENNDLIKYKNKFIINGDTTNSYTFKRDYYFMLGDNRHNSSDSRFWGFVPENYLVGKAQFILFSLDKSIKENTTIRWKRMFKRIE